VRHDPAGVADGRDRVLEAGERLVVTTVRPEEARERCEVTGMCRRARVGVGELAVEVLQEPAERADVLGVVADDAREGRR
jgi:hypothetical protein